MRVHEVAVQAILDKNPGAKKTGFMKAVRKILGEPFPNTIIPDAWEMIPDKQEIIAFEVEDSHAIPDYKMARYTRLWWWLDSEYWDLSLLVCNRWGDPVKVELFDYSMRVKRMEIEKRRSAAAKPLP